MYNGKWSNGGMPPRFSAKQGGREVTSREVPARAQTFLKFNYDALARRKQPIHAERPHFFFFGRVVGASGAVAREGAQGSPFDLCTTI